MTERIIPIYGHEVVVPPVVENSHSNTLMEYEVHVPVEQYGFILGKVTGTAEDAAREYHEIKQAIGFGDGMPDTKFREYYDLVANGEAINGDPGILEEMNAFQRFAINEMKKCFKRVTHKLNPKT